MEKGFLDLNDHYQRLYRNLCKLWKIPAPLFAEHLLEKAAEFVLFDVSEPTLKNMDIEALGELRRAYFDRYAGGIAQMGEGAVFYLRNLKLDLNSAHERATKQNITIKDILDDRK